MADIFIERIELTGREVVKNCALFSIYEVLIAIGEK